MAGFSLCAGHVFFVELVDVALERRLGRRTDICKSLIIVRGRRLGGKVVERAAPELGPFDFLQLR